MLGKYTLVKSKISKTKGLLSLYLPGHDVRQAFNESDYVKSLLLAANHTESQMRLFYNRYQEQKKGKITPKDLIKYNNFKLKHLINWCKSRKIISPKERKILHELREIRNDIAHNYQLNFNHNIDTKVCKRVIDTILPVINGLHKRIIEELKTSKP
jgi:hypothetical protein